MDNLLNARDKMSSGKINAETDMVFVRHLIKNIQKVDSGIGAYIFPEVKQIVFYWRNIIIYKCWLDEHNIEDTSMEEHKKKVAHIINWIKLGFINIKPMQKEMKNFNKHKTGKLL